MTTNGYEIRKVLLEVCQEYSNIGPGYFQSGSVLRKAATVLSIRHSLEEEQALLTAWSDLFRSGVLAWGYDLANSAPPFLHLTEIGRRTLQQLSRDPYNPDGYLATISSYLPQGSVALSYIEEGVRTFQAGCVKATAVMVGAAAESIVLGVRDHLSTRLNLLNAPLPAKLQGWKIKPVRDAITDEIVARKKQLNHKLYERFSAFWVSMSDQMRLTRNDAGHPVSVDPVTHETVHAALLIFPDFARLADDLNQWIDTKLI